MLRWRKNLLSNRVALLWGALASLTADAVLARPPCLHEQVTKARHTAELSAKSGDYATAHKTLNGLQESCELSAILDDSHGLKPNLDYYWVQSDASLYLYKLQKYDECRTLLGPILTPRRPSGILMFEDQKPLERVTQALNHNNALCEDAVAKRRQSAKYESNPCPHPGLDGILIPSAALPPGFDAGCVALQPAQTDSAERNQILEEGGNANPDRMCPKVAVMLRRAGKWQKQVLRANGGSLKNVSECCNLEQLAIAFINKQRRISVSGGGHSCFGGTAYWNTTSDYHWNGNTLHLLEDSSVAEH